MLEAFKKSASKLFEPWGFLATRTSKPWYPLLSNVVFFSAIALLGVASALIVLEPWAEPKAPFSSIRVDNIEVPTGNPRPPELMVHARNRLQSVVTLKGPDSVHRLKWVDMGASVDFEMLGRLIENFGKDDSSALRNFKGDDENETPMLPMPIYLDSEQAVEALMSLKELINRAPKKASFDFREKSVIKEENGLTLDVYGTLERLDEALAKNYPEIEMAVESTKATVIKDDLENIKVSSVVGYYETPYSRMRKDKHRTHNVKLGASMLNGQVLMPGKTFSFNETLGARSEARGFRYAPVIAGGVVVEGMGGGTCQVASTLNSAAFFAGLVVVERRPHSRPSSYIKLGLDATVSYPDIDLKLKNPFDFPVIVHFTALDGKLRAEILGPERSFTTTFLRKITGTTPFPVRVIDDSKVARGKEIITQNGTPGYTVRRYQIIEKDKVAYRFQTMDKYPPTTQFVHKGIGDPAAVKNVEDPPKPDTHKPYRAAPYLRMVQGKDDLWYEQSHD